MDFFKIYKNFLESKVRHTQLDYEIEQLLSGNGK